MKTAPAAKTTYTAARSETTARSAAYETAVIGSAAPHESTAAYKSATSVVTTATVEPAAIKAATPVESTTVVTTMEPRTRADEHATHEPVRSVVAIGCARVWRITVVAVGANRSRTISVSVSRGIVTAPVSHAHRNTLRARLTRAKQANSHQQTSNSNNL